jgi:hypothetical protein
VSSRQANGVRIAAALAWEFFALGWWGILLAPLGAMVLPGLIFGILSWQHDVSLHDTREGVMLQFAFYWTTIIFIGSAVVAALGDPKRRCTLPASSLLIVGCPMVCAMTTMFVSYSIVAILLNTLFEAGWPIWGPGLLAAIVIAWAQAVLWSTTNSPGWQFSTCVASVVTLLFATARWSRPYGHSTPFLQSVTAWHVVGFGLATVVYIGVGTVGFANQRSGSGLGRTRIVDWASRLWPKTARSAPFLSPTSAQFWLEWTERACALPVGTALIGMAAILLACFVSLREGADDFVGGMSGLVLAPAFVFGIVLGSRSPTGEFGSFGGSRPLTDRQIASVVLKSGTLALISSAMIWTLCMAATLWIVEERAELPKLSKAIQQWGPIPFLARATFGVLGLWSVVGLMTSLSLAGRKLMGIAVATASLVAITGVLVPNCLPSSARAAFVQAYCFVFVSLSLLAVLATFVASARRQLLSRRAIGFSAGLVLAAAVTVLFSGWAGQWKYLLPALAGCAMLPVPLAAAPLAVWTNRHR